MPELRRDAVTGRWVVVATERAVRPSAFSHGGARGFTSNAGPCPFCPGNEAMTPPEVDAVRPGGGAPDSPGWQVRVVPNMFPAFVTGGPEESGDGLFRRRGAVGSHEVIIHTPRHDADLATMAQGEVELVMEVYRRRYRASCADPDVKYVHLIVNHGSGSGASVEHSHSQLFGMPYVPPLLLEELEGASRFAARGPGCVFCAMLAEESADGERLVAANGSFAVIAPFASRLPFELWVVPREHAESFGSASDADLADLAAVLRDVLGRYRAGFGDPPYNCYIHSAPCDGGSYPWYHWHLEMVPRLTTPGAFELGTSTWINVTTPERAAEYLSVQVGAGHEEGG